MLLVCFRDDYLELDNQIIGSSLGKTNFFLSQQSLIAYGSSSRKPWKISPIHGVGDQSQEKYLLPG